jgi:hypothetical protein
MVKKEGYRLAASAAGLCCQTCPEFFDWEKIRKMKPGRKTRFATIHPIGATDTRVALSPVVRLAQLERSIYNVTVTRNPHLKPADVVMLTAFAKAAARVLKPGRLDTAADIEKSTRIMALLARSLRLTPQSTTDPKTAARSRRDAQPNPLAEYLAERDGDIRHVPNVFEEETDDDEQA